MALSFSFLVVQLLISESRLSTAQASSSLKCNGMCTFTYATLTIINEAFPLVTQVQLYLSTVTAN